VKPSADHIRQLPKVLLHEHLDGGLRPQTVVDLAKACNYRELPTDNPAELAEWFHRGANKGSLPEYLEGFAHTIAVMQTRQAIERVAFEFIEDMFHDGVIYAEARFAPCFHTQKGLTPEAVAQAAIDGFNRGKEKYGVEWGLIICAMRDRTDSLEWADMAIDLRHRGVVGFDLAGEEAGFPPKKHVDAFHAIQQANFFSTLHAGEAFGIASIWQALQICGAHRLGHATRLTDGMTIVDGKVVNMGSLAEYILDRRIPLEMCLSSNVHTGAVAAMSEHPFRLYYDRGFRVTLNTDDRLMSDTTMTKEFQIAMDEFGLEVSDLERITMNSMKSAFIHFKERCRLIYEVIKPGYARLRGG
jgi:adenosine deaminase